MKLIRPETDPPESDDFEPHLVMNFEPTVTGRRAHGKLDYTYAFMHIIVTVLEAKEIQAQTLDAATFQLTAQFRAIYDETLRGYCDTYTNLSEEVIAEHMEKYPNYGLVSTADRWSFVRYGKTVGGKWKLERSDVLSLDLPLGRRPDKVLLRKQLADILGPLAGIVTCGMRDVRDLEGQLSHANKLAARTADVKQVV